VRQIPLWIGGQERSGIARRLVRVPYDGEPFALVEQAGRNEVSAAVEAAARASHVLRELTNAERAEILRRARLLLLARQEEMAQVIASESGKPLREARMEAERASHTLLFSSEEASRLAGEVVPMDALQAGKGRMAMTLRVPLGVIAAITPFNFPLNLSVHKIGPALAAGNAVVHKPASATPVSAWLLAQILHEAGLPAGGLNVIPGPGIETGLALVEDPRVRMITFTGSADVGMALRAKAGMKRVTLELGNNSALIVEPDADLDDCAARAVPGAYANSGQVCISVQRVLVHRDVESAFVRRFSERAAELRVGHPLDDSSEVSSLICGEEADRVENWIKEAERGGARRVFGAERRGTTVMPALLLDVPEECRLFQQEAFGPVAGVRRYEKWEEAVAAVNRSEYGLQAGIFTRDLGKAFAAARQVEVGGFLINDVPQFRLDHMPYGGVKGSGTGREGPKYAIEEMTETRLVSWRW
jgi:acyl-CoA reductase-like NAD-dependent aldehyde dehydrogenase